MKHKLESRLQEEISITSEMQMTPPYGRKRRGTKESFDDVKEESEKSGFKLNIQKANIMASGPITSWQRWGNSGNSDRLYFGGLQNHYRRRLQS